MSLSKEERLLLSELPRQQYIRERVFRNIPTAHPSKNLFWPAILTNREASILDQVANIGSSIDHNKPQKDRLFQYGYNEDTSFCFDAVIISNTRFSDGKPVWYGSDDLDTSKAEVIFHLKRQALKELGRDVEEYYLDFERVVFEGRISFDGVDLTHKTAAIPGLLENGPPYPSCSVAGGILRALGSEGLIFASVRRVGGINYAIFERQCVSSSRATCYFSVRIFKDGRIEVCGEEYVDSTR